MISKSPEGFTGLGLHCQDTMATVGQIGFPEMRRILKGSGIKFLEIEFLQDWHAAGPARAASDRFRRQLFDVTGELGMRGIKIAPGLQEATADVPLMAAC
jgi:sugar phosphate isomerase/epimerase